MKNKKQRRKLHIVAPRAKREKITINPTGDRPIKLKLRFPLAKPDDPIYKLGSFVIFPSARLNKLIARNRRVLEEVNLKCQYASCQQLPFPIN